MAVLVSPGVSISVIDESINVGAGPGTVPLIFIATQENKSDPTGLAIAPGTLKENAGKVYSITSQRDLVQTFGDPLFYEVSGTSLNGYPLNEYGLLADYSYMGIANLSRVVRADIDTAQLQPTPIEPTSPAAVGTYWFDESALPNGSSYGLFVRSGTFPNEIWTPVTIDYKFNFPTGTSNVPSASVGTLGQYAVVFQTASGNVSYWRKGSSVWAQLGATTYTSAAGATSSVTYTSTVYTSAVGATSTGTTIAVNSTTGLIAGMSVQVTSGVGAFAVGTKVLAIVGPTSFTVTAAPTTPLSGGATVISGGAGNTGNIITVPSTTGLSAGMIPTIAAGVGSLAANTIITAVTSSTTFTVNNAPTVALAGGATTLASGGTITVGSTAGLAVGMVPSVSAGTGSFAPNTKVTQIVNGTTFRTSAAPSVALSGGASVVTASANFAIQSVWPDLTSAQTTQVFWVKTSSPAQGANFVLRRMDTTLNQFIQQEAPILANDTDADTFYSTDPTKSLGKIYIKPVITGGATAVNSFTFNASTAATPGTWNPITAIIGSESVPTSGPANGQLWFNALLGLDNDGFSTVDILIADGQSHWININLPGFTGLASAGGPTLYTQSQDPRDNVPPATLVAGDIWVDTDVRPYPKIQKWNGASWALVDVTDQTTPNGIIFTDVRPSPLFGTNQGTNNGGTSGYPDLDPDAPDSDLYPRGFMLWNTRYSTNNVKEWVSPYVFNDVAAAPDNTNNGSLGRWVNNSGNDAAGAPYMGADAQQICIVRAIQSVITSNDEIRAEDLYYNLIAAPGFVEAIDEMLVLNSDRKETSFVLGDTPFNLNPSGTTLQAWATNSNLALGNGDGGLVSSSKYFGAWYPSGLSTNVDGTDVVVPPTHMALRTIAYNDQVAYPWFAPAGLQRGVVNNAASVGYVNSVGQFVPVKLNEGQRDILYQNGINPIRVMPNGGIVVFGQKTRQSFSSATDRINVVRLENYLRYQLNNLAQPFLFEPNDSITRKAVKDAFDRFLSELITLRGLYDFLVVCDLSNNTPARIDRNELWIDIAIQPVKAIEFIYIPIRIKNTGASLTN
jgi:hypothetical protein